MKKLLKLSIFLLTAILMMGKVSAEVQYICTHDATARTVYTYQEVECFKPNGSFIQTDPTEVTTTACPPTFGGSCTTEGTYKVGECEEGTEYNCNSVGGLLQGQSCVKTQSEECDTANGWRLSSTITLIEKPTTSKCINPTYNGTNQAVVGSADTGYSWSGSISHIDADNYDVTATLSSGYKWSDGSSGNVTITCKIKTKSVEVSWGDATLTYNGQTQKRSASASTGVAGESMTLNTNASVYKKVGTYDVQASCSAVNGGRRKCSNYHLTNNEDIQFEIVARGLTVTATNCNKRYNGTDYAPCTLSTDKISGDDVSVTSDGCTFDNANIGTNKTVTCTGIRLTGNDASNYTLTNSNGRAITHASITSDSGDPDPGTVAVTGITISPKTKTIDAYESLQMTATIAPSNATNKNVTWQSSDPTVAQISSQGEVFALKAGTVTITVTTEDGSKTDTATITVNGVLKLKETNYTCSAGSEVGTFVTSSAGLPQFRSSASTIVTIEKHPTLAVNCAGCFAVRINCLTEGTATVYASVGGKESQATVTVVGAETPKKSITLDANGGVIYVDDISTDSYETEDFETVKLSDLLSNVTYSREGYTFVGWFTSSTGGDQIDVNNKLKDITVSTIYARWEENSDEPVVDPTLPTVTLTYNLNGRGSCSEESKTVNTGDNWGTLCTPTSKGYTFRGWFTGKSSGSEVKSTTEASEDITVYAHWTQNKADSNAKTGIYTPIAAILILGVASCIAFIVIRKRKTEL